ncbi:hypothetical protein PIROE2DRAFT_9526 [Piromyces sp. E2]|nr:hypothetical protein PIROE2DRAFT_9526 [Piromyces sp. E2]|eukprot:OUM63857.1 hypothetical protein PIROE2DRAFT_9526 [Piromyces sp. E2]
MGGGVYTPSKKDQNMFDINNFIFKNNTINLFYKNDYTTKPYSISLNSKIENIKITSGETSIKKQNNDYNNNNFKNSNSHIIGNIGTFINGNLECYCEFNNARIYNNNTYILNLTVENYYDNIIIDFPYVEVDVSYCNEFQIAYYDHNDILHCDNALCNSKCSNYTCIPDINNINNNPYKNKCQCDNGFKGEFCEYKIKADFRNEYKFKFKKDNLDKSEEDVVIYQMNIKKTINNVNNPIDKSNSNLKLKNDFSSLSFDLNMNSHNKVKIKN